MSAVAAEPETTRYEGLIRTAQELLDTHEESGWRLANVIHDAVEELRQQGFMVAHGNDRERMTATRRVALDMDRYKMGAQTVYNYHKLWRKFGDSAQRHPVNAHRAHVAEAIADAIEASDWLQERDGINRLLGAIAGSADADEAHTALVTRLKVLADQMEAGRWPTRPRSGVVADIRALIGGDGS